MVNSTVSSKFANAISLRVLTASARLYLRVASIFSAAARYFFPCFFIFQLRGANEILEFQIWNLKSAALSPSQSNGESGVRQFEIRNSLFAIRNYSIVNPICRAVPSMVRIALSRFVVFKSGIFVLAISSTLAREILPTFSFLGLPAPFDIPAAFFNRSAAGGVLVSKVNERSA